MKPQLSIITAAYKAEATLATTVRSVLAQSMDAWEMIISVDDGVDYRAVLRDQGIDDPRVVFVSTGRMGAGSGATRNVGLDAARADIIAVLDGDDLFATDRVEKMLPAAHEHGLVSSGVHCIRPEGALVLAVGCEGKARWMTMAEYLPLNISTQSMVMFDRRRITARWPEGYVWEDYVFAMQAMDQNGGIWHMPEALFYYVKQEVSASAGPEAAQRMIEAKRHYAALLERQELGIEAPEHRRAFQDFLTRSLRAEETFSEAQAKHPSLIFEQHLKDYL